MSRFYQQGINNSANGINYWVGLSLINGSMIRVNVTKDIYNEITDLQREYWRQEKRESRHTWHLELINEFDLPEVQKGKGPEQLLVEAYDRAALLRAMLSIPEIQRRRFLLHYLDDFTLEEIAKFEGCSNRAISYSLTLARRNLRELLLEDFDF